MSDFFEIVGRQLHDAAAGLEPARPVPRPARRHRSAGIAIAAGAVIAVAVFAGGILLLGGSGSQDRRSASPALVTWNDQAAGLAVSYPPSWHRATASLTPHLIDPVERLSLATFPLTQRVDQHACAQVPVASLRAVRTQDIFLTLTERVASDHAHFAPRTHPLELGPAITTETRGCVKGPGPWREHLVSFSDAGRQFSILVVIGTKAPAASRRQLRAILESLQFIRGMAPHLPARH